RPISGEYPAIHFRAVFAGARPLVTLKPVSASALTKPNTVAICDVPIKIIPLCHPAIRIREICRLKVVSEYAHSEEAALAALLSVDVGCDEFIGCVISSTPIAPRPSALDQCALLLKFPFA